MSVTLMTETNLYKDDAIADGLEDASKVATNYLSYNAQDGLTVGRTGQSERAVIASDGMEIYDGLNDQIVQFKSVTRLGIEGEANLKLDYHSMQLQDTNGNTYVHLSDLRDNEGYATVADTFTGDGTTRYFYPTYSLNIVINVTIDGVEASDYTYSISSLNFTNAPSNGSTIIVNYKTSNIVRAYTFGSRKQNTALGADSFVNGYNCEANGRYSHAEGSYCVANGFAAHAEGDHCTVTNSTAHAEGYGCTASSVSHAEGYQCTTTYGGAHAEGRYCEATRVSAHAEGEHCIADGLYSHAEGYYCTVSDQASHAEGYHCTASGNRAHAEGSYCVAGGKASHAQGDECEATGDYSFAGGISTQAFGLGQFIIGKYNVSSQYDEPTFMVGGGTSSSRKNALSLNHNGNLTIAGTLTQSSDKRLKHHRAYLSDQQNQVNEFINRLKPVWFEKDEQKHLGFYAQDVQQTDRWQCMVDNDTNGYLTLSYTDIIAPLVAYCQNLEQKVDTLEARIARLEQLLNQQ